MTKLNKKEQIEFYENKRLDERVVRWDAYRINQFSYANNLLLTLNLAFLGFLTTKNTLELAPGFLLGSIQILCGVSLIASFVSGLLLVLNRLKDFRLTAKLTKKRRRNKREKKTYCSNLDYEINKLRKKTKYLGNRSWCLFNWQIWTFSKESERKFIKNWRERVGFKMDLEIIYVDSISVEASGKFRIVKNNIKHFFNENDLS